MKLDPLFASTGKRRQNEGGPFLATKRAGGEE